MTTTPDATAGAQSAPPAPDTPLPGGGAGAPAAPAAPLGPDPNASLLTAQPAAGGGGGLPASAADAERLKQLGHDITERANRLQQSTVVGQALVDQRQDINKTAADATNAAVAKDEADRAQEAVERSAIKSRHEEYQTRAQSELDKMMASGVDPSRYFYSMSTPSKIMAGIAMASGTFGAHPLGARGAASSNDALKIIQQAQQDDIDTQKTDMQNRITLMGKKLDLNKEGFSQDMAMHEATVQSRAASHAATMALIDKQSALAAGSVDAQQGFQSLKESLATQYADAQKKDQDESYRIAKTAELARQKEGAGAGNTPKAYREYRAGLLEKGFTEESAGKLAAEKYGLPTQAGAQIVTPTKGAGSARGAPKVEEYRNTERAASDLAKLTEDNGGRVPLTGPNAGEAAAAIQSLEQAGYKPPGGWESLTNVSETDAKGREHTRATGYFRGVQAHAKASGKELYDMIHGASPDAGGEE
jgi:hypothetical protein